MSKTTLYPDRVSTDTRSGKSESTPLRGRIDKRHAIMTAARIVFLRDGYTGATIDAVAAEAGVSKQTIYNHLQDKEMLFLAVVEDTLRHYSANALTAVAEFPEHPAELERELITVGWRITTSFLHEDALAMRRLLHTEVVRHPDLIGVWCRWGPPSVVVALSERFTRLVWAGYLELTDPDQAARQFFSLITYDSLLQYALGTHPITDDGLRQTASAAAHMFLRTYAPR
jgi:AcrR family transcriptional regulator